MDLALESVVRSAAERGSRAAGAQASPLVGPLLENLVLSTGDNEELCYCLKAWQDLSGSVQAGTYPSKEEALRVSSPSGASQGKGVLERQDLNDFEGTCSEVMDEK